MDDTLFWRLKLIQFFHDPLNKPLTGYPFIGRQSAAARKYAQLAIGHRVYTNRFTQPADWAAAGADRPVLDPARNSRPPQSPILWYRRPIVSHPLAPQTYRLEWTPAATGEAEDKEQGEERAATLSPADLAWESDRQLEEAAREIGERLTGWQAATANDLKADYLRLYRELYQWPDSQAGVPPWHLLPADTRVPDHAVVDHLKVVCALNHLLYERDPADKKKAVVPPEREPWLLRLSLGPVGPFIAQSRSGRDLWTSSFLLAELMWQAIEVLAEHYGPDCIVYPDLNGNPRADGWLVQRHGLLDEDNPNTFAAVVPNALVAIVPRGGKGHLQDLEALIHEAEKAIHRRWNELRDVVHRWIKEEVKGPSANGWERIWQRQSKDFPLRIHWNAVPWRKPEPITTAASLDGLALIPVREADLPPEPPAADIEALQSRHARLKPWVPEAAWTAYEQARHVYARLNLAWVQNERGFDYALTHHQLNVRHALGKQIPLRLDGKQAESGEKCTLCGEREALHDGDGSGQGIDSRRAAVRAFWANPRLDPDETGAERLCSVCAVKRFLVEAGRDVGKRRLDGLTPVWAGPKTPYDAVIARTATGIKVRHAFPSTSMIAAQDFLVFLGQHRQTLAGEIQAVVDACEKLDLPRTAFPETLPRLASLHRQPGPLAELLEYDPQYALFPHALEGKIHQAQQQGKSREVASLRGLQSAVRALLRAAAHASGGTDGVKSPQSRIAVIKIDGDQMGRLLLGAEERMGATWRDVLHPDMIDRIVAEEEDNPFQAAGWPALLEAKRLMGPSLHAFVSRALGHFAHRIVPWVVEREYSGRVIYSGGDDVLCIAPAEEALEIAARLQQLWSAAWVADRGNPDEPVNGHHSEWAWRLPGWQGEHDARRARQRFQVLRPGQDGPISWPSTDAERFAPHVSGDPATGLETDGAAQAELLPMLGPAQSLSAGIAFAHFKTSMAHLVRTAEHLLEDVAKDRAGRAAVAVKLFSRNAEKSEFALPWVEEAPDQITAHRRLGDLIGAFADGRLPGRLPYKLREQIRRLGPMGAWRDPDQGDRLCQGLLARSLEGELDATLHKDVLAIWRQGMRLYEKDIERDLQQGTVQGLERSLDGLLFCRAMASQQDEEE